MSHCHTSKRKWPGVTSVTSVTRPPSWRCHAATELEHEELDKKEKELAELTNLLEIEKMEMEDRVGLLRRKSDVSYLIKRLIYFIYSLL